MNPRKTYDPTTAWITDTSRFALLSDAGEGGNEGGGGGGSGNGNGADNGAGAGDGSSSAVAPQQNWEEFTRGLESLNTNLGGGLDTLIREVRDLRPATPEPAPPNFDEMSRQELTAHIVGTVTKAVEGMLNTKLEPVVNTVNGLQQSMSAREVNGQIETLKSTKKDFNDWKPQMLALAKEHQTLTVPQLYALARAENPNRATELDRKYNPPEPKAPRWGGLTASAGSPVGSNGAAPEKFSGREATIEAYKQVQAKNPHVLRALEDLA